MLLRNFSLVIFILSPIQSIVLPSEADIITFGIKKPQWNRILKKLVQSKGILCVHQSNQFSGFAFGSGDTKPSLFGAPVTTAGKTFNKLNCWKFHTSFFAADGLYFLLTLHCQPTYGLVTGKFKTILFTIE